MKTIEERRDHVDRSRWPSGPWDSEPDFKQWLDESTGLPCLIVRNRRGALCGYVGASVGHPYFEKGYEECEARVHGGLTYADHCADGICHTVEPGEDDNVWWLGFDCAHAGDASPSDDTESIAAFCRAEVYRDMDYVSGECRSLAKQLADSARTRAERKPSGSDAQTV